MKRIEDGVINQKYKELSETVDDIKKNRNNYLWTISRKYDNDLKMNL
jgi:hypothetical protein